ncbi:MAG: HIT domain-containing protein [Candidatus Omnitrophica bacterium]|nr:HIT domain-containing protein [Candidatus Omnitrophota bacterium]MBU2044473.1 HIT domain-containing protein [Candidatus Omnitrophota bacterium]MBU2266111.1 HIT domain-containing protein [Candidatus Omnitrophota bacterium]MBU2474103.1 HIT domain-containing protein [Candidatus Omnitrophota bacterium]
MNKLWAPWRIHYIQAKKVKECVFCKIASQKTDQANFILYRSQYCFAVLNIFPYNNGHSMIVTNRHVKSLEKLEDSELLDIMKTLVKTKAKIKKILKPEGFNVGINLGKESGAGIAGHLHIHLVPRWRGDTNFMPVIAKTKIISQSLKELCRQFKKK